MKTGDRVKILRTDIVPKDIPGSMGTVVGVNGAYIYVRPDNYSYELELYEVELESVQKPEVTVIFGCIYYGKDNYCHSCGCSRDGKSTNKTKEKRNAGMA